jgi:predicted nucleic acid-binding protein
VRPYVSILPLEEEYELALEFITKYGIKPSDSLHLGVMKKNDVYLIVSEDKVNWIKRIWY